MASTELQLGTRPGGEHVGATCFTLGSGHLRNICFAAVCAHRNAPPSIITSTSEIAVTPVRPAMMPAIRVRMLSR